MNTKRHAVTDARGRPIRFFMTAGQVSDYTGARALLSSLPNANWLLGDRGYDADWFREARVDKKITPCIPGRKSREKLVKYDKRRYRVPLVSSTRKRTTLSKAAHYSSSAYADTPETVISVTTCKADRLTCH